MIIFENYLENNILFIQLHKILNSEEVTILQ